MYNAKEITVTMTRGELCDIMIGMTVLDINSGDETKKWNKLHRKLNKILKDFDDEHFEEWAEHLLK